MPESCSKKSMPSEPEVPEKAVWILTRERWEESDSKVLAVDGSPEKIRAAKAIARRHLLAAAPAIRKQERQRVREAVLFKLKFAAGPYTAAQVEAAFAILEDSDGK